jgi:hypothetical protein
MADAPQKRLDGAFVVSTFPGTTKEVPARLRQPILMFPNKYNGINSLCGMLRLATGML